MLDHFNSSWACHKTDRLWTLYNCCNPPKKDGHVVLYIQNQWNAKPMGTRNCQPPITQNDSDQLPHFMQHHIQSSHGICSFAYFWLLPRPKLHNWLDIFLLSLSFCSLSLFLGSSGSSSMEQVSWLMLPRAPWRFEFHMRDPSFHIFALWRGISYLKHRITTSWIPPPPKFPLNTLFGDNFLLIQYQHIKQS